ncbi:MAG: ACS family MFS transporter [Gammaproteobacteria bacterium]|nr:ACS family MFS transporter [Gammaproteobacteria bacterium]
MASSWPKRYNVVALCFCAAFICYIDRVNISVASIAMADRFGWSETEKGFVLSSFFIGYMLAMGVAGWVSDRYGAKRVLGIAVVWWSLFTFLTPFAATASFGILIAARIAMGIGEAATMPASYGMFARWVPARERARSVSLFISGIPIGTLFGLIATGWIVAEFGWPAAFYVFGLVGLLWVPFWYFAVHDEPRKHPGISADELAVIGNLADQRNAKTSFPWRTFLRLPAFWALLINHFCSTMAMYIALAWLPSYFRDVQGLTISGAGLYSAAPWLSMFLMTNVGGWLADSMIARGISTTTVRKIMQISGLLGAAMFILLVQFAPTAGVAVLLLSAVMGFTALTVSGYGTNHLDIAPNHAGLLMGITNTVGTIPGVVGVALTGFLIDLTGTYNSVFVMVAGVNIVGAAIWALFASGERLVD